MNLYDFKLPVDLSIIIPVKDNQSGINLFLEHLPKAFPNAVLKPKEIIIVDNNSNSPISIPNRMSTYPIPIILLTCKKIGPASARNIGAKYAKGIWLLFTDSDCIPTETFISGYFKAKKGAIAYSGNIKSVNNDSISKYYDSQEIFIPPSVINGKKEKTPFYLVTANCLIHKYAFELVGGFNEKFYTAAGEDVDLAFRLKQIGSLHFALDSLVLHNVDSSIKDFWKRFYRYGKGNRQVEELHNVSMKPRIFIPKKKNIINFYYAIIEWLALYSGYKRYNF